MKFRDFIRRRNKVVGPLKEKVVIEEEEKEDDREKELLEEIYKRFGAILSIYEEYVDFKALSRARYEYLDEIGFKGSDIGKMSEYDQWRLFYDFTPFEHSVREVRRLANEIEVLVNSLPDYYDVGLLWNELYEVLQDDGENMFCSWAMNKNNFVDKMFHFKKLCLPEGVSAV